MSAPANPYDNAQAESFMKTLKVEEVYLAGFEKFSDVATRLSYFIEEIYNERRMHSALEYRSPNHFEAQQARQALRFSTRLGPVRGGTPIEAQFKFFFEGGVSDFSSSSER
jgi:putative transposase